MRIKKLFTCLLAGTLLLNLLPSCENANTVFAADGAKPKVTISQNTVTIGNSYLERSFNITEKKLSPKNLSNKRANLNFTPAADSEEFIIKLRADNQKLPGELDRSNWTAAASDQRNNTPGSADGPAENTIDGNPETIWHSNYLGSGSGANTPYPHYLLFDMKQEETIQAFSYLPRQDASTNGDMGDYKLYVGDQASNLDRPENLAGEGTYIYNERNCIYVNLPSPKTGRYVMLKTTAPKTNQQIWATAAEIKLYDQPISSDMADNSLFIHASDLTLDTEHLRSTETETGIMAEFPFETFEKNGIHWNITMKIVMNDGDHFMRKFLELQTDAPQDAAIDYIDLESLNVNTDDAIWTHPASMQPGAGNMPGYLLSLGQPVYIQGMFLGCEFPMTDTEIDASNNAHMRYYTGKTFQKLEEDHQMTTDGKYITWPTVVGAARSTDMNVIQSDFYAYIKTIAAPTNFRTQYNSWFDNTLGITEDNIATAFTRMEKGLSESGVAPLDSYVVDDGWNNYNSDKYNVHDELRSGTTTNKTGFWEFNSKFPNGFEPAYQLTKNFGSGFGVWLGPRGGYNYPVALAKMIEDAGYGAFNTASQDIDIADKRYIRKVQEFLIQEQDDHKINYWKLDGFAKRECRNSSHHHMTGGYKDMYYYTDNMEAWIDLFEALRANAVQNDIKNLWLNLTCYINPSPWLLQWANSVWLQVSDDMNRLNVGQSRQVDLLLSYRDNVYFDFVKTRQFQFPLENIYNHDPIYGKTETNLKGTMTDEEFKTYLYMMSTRGTAFWELYYSPEMIDEGQKWAINAEFLEWLEKNHHILKNAKLIGNPPSGRNTYGYSCWDGEEGIISMRNPTDQTKDITYVLDRNIGAAESLSGKRLHRTTILNYKTTDTQTTYKTVSYGDHITVTLQPGEARIWHLSTKADTTPAQIAQTQTLSNKKIKITFDERIQISRLAASATGNTVTQTELTADEKSVIITLGTALASNETAEITLNDITDLSGNTQNYTASVPYYENGVVAKVSNAADLKNASNVTEHLDETLGKNVLTLNNGCELASASSITGTSDFSISSYIKTTSDSSALIKQGDEYMLSIDKDGRLNFTVGNLSVTSEDAINDGKWKHVSGIRELNGVIKIYINGVLAGSSYDAASDAKNIAAAPISIGSPDAAIQICETEVKDRTITLAEFAEKSEFLGEGSNSGIVPDENGKIPLSASNILVKRADTHESVSNTESPSSKMIDGNTASNSFTCTNQNFESVTLNGTSAYFEVDLGDKFFLDQIKMWRYYADSRTYQDTIIIASEDNIFDTNDTVLYSTVSNADHAYGLLSAEKLASPDPVYQETSSGKTFAANGKKARYLRIYMRGSTLQNGSAHGGSHICELEIYGRNVVQVTPPDTFKITFNTTGGNKISSLKVSPGETWTFPDTPVRNGYTFDGWYSDVNRTQIYKTAEPVNSNLTLFAKWKKVHTISFYTNGGSIPASLSILSGEKANAPETPVKDSYSFDGWYLDHACTRAFHWDTVIEKDYLLYAKWNRTTEEPINTAKKDLLAKLESAKTLKKEDYTDETWDVFQKAVSYAEKVIAESTSETAYEEALRLIHSAIENLQKKVPVDPKPDKPTPDEETPDTPVKDGQTFVNGNYHYKIISAVKKTAMLTGIQNKNITKVKIANTVTLNGHSYTVTKFAASAFKGNKKITRVTIGKNITVIPKKAFMNCKKLQKVTANSTKLKQIKASAFSGCSKLKTIKIKSKNLKKVQKKAFKGIHRKASIRVPAAKLKAYQKLLSKKGQSRTVKIRK